MTVDPAHLSSHGHVVRRLAALSLFLLAACGGSDGASDASREAAQEDRELVVQPANYDLVAGEESRFIAGVLTQDQLFVGYGQVEMTFLYLGTEESEGTVEEGPTATADFLVIEGDPRTEGPIAGPASSGRGVYSTDVTFDKPGFWEVELTADLDGGTRSGRAAFEVLDEHRIPAVGDAAPRTSNRTLESDVPPRAIDSRAESLQDIPDPQLHEITIAESIRNGEPVVVVFATPVYCVSRFCGPITDMVQDLQKRYSDRANFVHVEIWFDFQDRAIDKAAAEWLLVDQDLTEPWVFLIDDKGKIAGRWDNVVTEGEVAAELEKLPKL